MRRGSLQLRLVPLLFLAWTGLAHADTAAEQAFARGREALKVGDYAEACAAFEESQDLDPRADTQFNIALCSQQLGKLARALRLHRTLSQRADNPRREKSAELAAELEPRVARVRLEIARKKQRPPPKGLVVEVDGDPVEDYDDLPVDLGTTRIVARAPGYFEWTGKVTATEEGETYPIVIRLERDPDAPLGDGEVVVPEDPIPPPSSSRKSIGVAAIVVGGFAFGGAAALGIVARNSWNDAKALCPDTRCPTQELFDQASVLKDDASRNGNIATGLAIAGGVAVVAGIVLWSTAPETAKRVAITPSAGPSSAYVTILGRF